MNARLRYSQRKQAAIKRPHERRRPADEKIEVVKGKHLFQQIYIDSAAAVVVTALDILGAGLAVADVDANIFVLPGEAANVGTHGVLTAIAGAVNEPYRSRRFALDDRVEHADHRREAHAAADEHDRPFAIAIEMKFAACGANAKRGSNPHLIVQVVRRDPGREAGVIRRSKLALDAHAILFRIWTVGQRVGA